MRDATLELRTPLGYATLIVLAARSRFSCSGSARRFFGPLAASYALAVLASMIVALLVAPALGLLLTGGAPASARTVTTAVAPPRV